MDTQQLKHAIMEEKKKGGVLILAHTYQDPDVLDIADIVGDSYALSKAAQNVPQNKVLMCGVRFMAETVKILSPEKEVLLSHADAGCPMAEQLAPDDVRRYREEHPDHAVCAYVNTTAQLKALADVCVTSSSAVEIVSRMPQEDILFIPDKNLGAYVQAMLPQKRIHLMDGYCPVHNAITAQMIKDARRAHPGAKVAIHPECPYEAVRLADVAGSTKEILDFIHSGDDAVIIATERGVYDALVRQYPGRALYQLEPELMTCHDMKKTTLQGVYDALTGKGGQTIELDGHLLAAARGSIENMLRYGGR